MKWRITLGLPAPGILAPIHETVVEAPTAFEATQLDSVKNLMWVTSWIIEKVETMAIFCSLECNREYHAISVGYPGDGDEDYCENCGTPLKEEL
jgi:hypothetical protein